MDGLTRIQKRELMWLAAHTDKRGFVLGDALEVRCRSGEIDFTDMATRYRALESCGYVDRLLFADDTIYAVRLTEEGRDAAQSNLEEELESKGIPDDVKKTVRDSMIGNTISLAFKALLVAVGFI